MGLANFNPFKRERQNFPGVVVPLASTSASHASTDSIEKDDKASDHAPSSSSSRGPEKASTSLTLEALRAEVEADIASSGTDTSYDRMYYALVFPDERDLFFFEKIKKGLVGESAGTK